MVYGLAIKLIKVSGKVLILVVELPGMAVTLEIQSTVSVALCYVQTDAAIFYFQDKFRAVISAQN